MKKKQFKKNKKKFKLKRLELRQIKKDKDELRKLGYLSKDFSDKVPCDEVYSICQIISKLIKHGREQASSVEEREAVELNEIPGLFKVLD